MQPLEIFKHIFPSDYPIDIGDELRYIMRSEACAKAYDYLARMLILAKGLPLIAMVDVWKSREETREIALVVRPAPEQDEIERSCGDGG